MKKGIRGWISVPMLVIGLYGCGQSSSQPSTAPQPQSTSQGAKAARHEQFEDFSFDLPSGWTRVAADRDKTEAMLLMGDVPPDMPKGVIPARTKGMIKVDAGKAALRSSRGVSPTGRSPRRASRRR